ncbi:MAG: winged helix-turn-helix domain-containing protein [Algicola sp.]|nr:winged helix-turn-helix domain-containing protein [Algicola sp.]
MTEISVPFQLANVRVDPATDELSCGDSTLTIQSMAMKVLCYFAANQGQVISRDCLREQVWQNSTASNHTINNHIYSLRRNLAKLDGQTKYIHTVTGSNDNGYRLLVPIVLLAEEKQAEETTEAKSPEITVIDKRPHKPKTPLLVGITFVVLLALGYLGYDLTRWQSFDQSSGLTFEQGREQSSAISLDGQILLYAHRPNRQATWELYAKRMDDGKLDSPNTPNNQRQPQKVFATNGNYDSFVSLSPDNQFIAFNRLAWHNEGIYVADFDAVTLTASNARKIIALDRDNLSPAISWLDSNRFFYTAKEAPGAPLRIYLHDLTLAKTEQVSSPPLNTFGDYAIMLSPDKHWLAVMRAEGYMGFVLYLYDINNKSIVATPVSGKEQRLNISFSDDSQAVYFVDEQGFLSAYDIEDKTTRLLSNQQYLGYWPLKVPGKEQFVMQQDWGLSSLTTQILRYNNPLTGGDGESMLLVNNGLSIRAIEGVANGGLIFAALKANFQIELWSYHQGKSFKLDQFNEKPEYRYPLSLNWLKGADKALLSINDSCRVVDINNGKDTPLCPADQVVYGATFGEEQVDNKGNIYLATQRNDTAMAIKMGSTGYPFEPMKALPNASVVKQVGNGQFYYRRGTEMEPGFDIYHYDANTTKTRLLIARTYLNNIFSTNDFVVVARGIYFMDRKPGKRNGVYFYHFDSERVEHLIDSPNEYPNIAISDDEKYLYQIQSVDNDSQLRLIEKTR